MLNGFDQKAFDAFVAGYKQLKKEKRVENFHPSRKMCDIFIAELQGMRSEASR